MGGLLDSIMPSVISSRSDLSLFRIDDNIFLLAENREFLRLKLVEKKKIQFDAPISRLSRPSRGLFFITDVCVFLRLCTYFIVLLVRRYHYLCVRIDNLIKKIR